MIKIILNKDGRLDVDNILEQLVSLSGHGKGDNGKFYMAITKDETTDILKPNAILKSDLLEYSFPLATKIYKNKSDKQEG